MVCADCVSGSLHPGTPTGQEITIGEIPTYAVGDENSTRIVVFGIDIFGWRFNNTRLLADEYAARGFRVLVPDLFGGYELPTWTLSARDPMNDTPTLFQRALVRPLSLFVLVPFVLRNSHAAQSAKLRGFAAALRTAHPNARLGLVGFCWGGRYAICVNDAFDATVAAHPSLVRFPDDLAGVTKPLAFAVAERDHDFNAARASEAEKALREKGVAELEVVVYEGMNHGWTIRGNLADPQQKAARDKARDQATAWFDKHLTRESESQPEATEAQAPAQATT